MPRTRAPPAHGRLWYQFYKKYLAQQQQEKQQEKEEKDKQKRLNGNKKTDKEKHKKSDKAAQLVAPSECTLVNSGGDACMPIPDVCTFVVAASVSVTLSRLNIISFTLMQMG